MPYALPVKEDKFPYPLSVQYLRRRLALSLFKPFDVPDSLGRPLMEGRSVNFPIPDSDFRRCPFNDSRSGHRNPMNLGALTRFREDRAEIMVILRTLTQTIRHYRPVFKHEPGSLFEIWRLAHSMRMLPMPDLLLSNYLGTTFPPISAPVSTAHKFALGVLDLVSFALRQGYPVGAICTPDHLYSFADEHGRFIGRTEVCPAPPKYMRDVLSEFIDALSCPSPQLAAPSNSADTYSTAVRIAKIQWTMHRFALMFDIARFRTWYRMQSHTGSSEMRPDVRHASAYAAEAQSIALLTAPLRAPSVHAMLDLDLRDDEVDSLDKSFDGFTNAAEHVIRATIKPPSLPLQADWTAIVRAALSVLQEAECQLGILLELPAETSPYIYRERDLDHFFGKAHPALCTN